MACQDANTGIKVEVSSKAANVAFGITVSGTGNTRTVVIQTDTAGRYSFRIWLVNDNADPDTITLNPPSGDATQTVWYRVTDSAGSLTFDVTHVSADTWYPVAVLVGPVAIGDALAFT